MSNSPQNRRNGAASDSAEDCGKTVASLPTLEQVLVSFQKSLARATLAAHNASRADPAFSLGERTLYVVDELEVELRAACAVASSRTDTAPDRVLLDLGAEPGQRSVFRFRVFRKPLERVEGEQLLLAELEPLMWPRDVRRFRVWAINRQGRAVAGIPVTIVLEPLEIEADTLRVSLTTDVSGGISFQIDTRAGSIEGMGVKAKTEVRYVGSVSPAWRLEAEAKMRDDEGSGLLRSEAVILPMAEGR